MFRFNRFRLLLAPAAFLCLAGLAAAQTKVAIVNLQRAMLETAELKKAQADMEAKFKPRQDEMEKLNREIQNVQQQLQTMQGKLTAQGEQELNVQLQRRQRELQRMTEDLQIDVDRERNTILSRSGQRMQEVIQKLAEQKGVDVVMNSVDTIYFKPALDLTDEAIAAYDKAHPVK